MEIYSGPDPTSDGLQLKSNGPPCCFSSLVVGRVDPPPVRLRAPFGADRTDSTAGHAESGMQLGSKQLEILGDIYD